MFWNKKEKHCKCHNDLKELQKLTEELKEAKKEIDKTKYEKILKPLREFLPYYKYKETNLLQNNELDYYISGFVRVLVHIIICGGTEADILSDSDLASLIVEFLNNPKADMIIIPKEFYYDLGQFFIKMSEATESLKTKEEKIKELEKQIKNKKEKLGIL